MSLGLCCQYLEPVTKRNGNVEYKNCIGEKSLQLGRYHNKEYSLARIKETYMHNIVSHFAIIPKLVAQNIKSFRLSSSLLPLWDLNKHAFESDPDLLNALRTLGDLFTSNGIRVTTHPGQFTVISSDNANVVKNSITELEMHAWVFDQMGLGNTAFNAINIHGGKSDRLKSIVQVYKSLPSNVRSRLTLENDERCYGVDELIKIHELTGIPVVFDSHHFTFNTNSMNFSDAYTATSHTWGGIKPLQHISNTEPGNENAAFNIRRSHSQYIHHIPEMQLEGLRANTIDVDVEAKQKNLAIAQIKLVFGLTE